MSHPPEDAHDTTRSHILRLLKDHVPEPGVVIDLGGDAHLAMSDLAHRVIDASAIDLTDVVALASSLEEIAEGQLVGAITAIDVIGHLPRPDDVLRALQAWMGDRDIAVLVLTLPNVGHVDLATKLLSGRWDVTPTGLLGEAQLRFFTDQSLDTLMVATGFTEIMRDDVRSTSSDQSWPPDHPTQSSGSMLSHYLRKLRESSDDYSETSRFVRLYAPASAGGPGPTTTSALTTEAVVERRSPFLTVVTRTVGNRSTLLDTLACLSGQTDGDFEVLLMLNTDDPGARDFVVDLIASFHQSFRDRIRVDISTEMHRVAPLNRALGLAHGRYVTILDDDDFVFGDWVEQFHQAADAQPGAVIRCRAVDQRIDTIGTDGAAVAASGFEASYRATFDLASHLAGGQSPQGTLAVPYEAINTFRLRFDEEMIVCEDIEFYLRATRLCGVVDTGTFGMVYRRWTDRFASEHTVSPEVWEHAIQQVVSRLDAGPLLMPAGTASRLYQAAVQERALYDLDQGTAALLRRATVAERNWASLVHAYKELEHDYDNAIAERDRAQARARAREHSWANAESLQRHAARLRRRILPAKR